MKLTDHSEVIDGCCQPSVEEVSMATILLIENDRGLAYALSKFLRHAGHNVRIAFDSMAALKMLDAAPEIDLLLTDLVMPVGHPHGLALARMGRWKRRDLAVIFMSRDADLGTEIDGDTILLKPIDASSLLDAIEHRLGKVARPAIAD
jgi:CheY-like chemotaxis protein